MQFKGVLNVRVSSTKNKAGQRPLEVEFVGEDGIKLKVSGARVSSDAVLDAQAVVNGQPYRHTVFSVPLQMAIIGAKPEQAEVNDDYQRQQTEKMNKRAKDAGAL